jgi:hypothetical protein
LESLREFMQVVQAEVALTALDAAYIRAVKTGMLGQGSLGPTAQGA